MKRKIIELIKFFSIILFNLKIYPKKFEKKLKRLKKIKLLEKEFSSEKYSLVYGENIIYRPKNEIDNITIVKKILKIMDKSEELIEFVEDRPGHDFRYSMTSKKISEELGWKIDIDFEKGLEKTIQWYLDNPEIMNNVSQTILDPTPWKN